MTIVSPRASPERRTRPNRQSIPLLADWHRLTAFLSLVEKAWPRGGDNNEDRTTTAEDRQAEPAPNERDRLWNTPRGRAAEDSQRFGRFQIVRTLGQGGFGIVFLAWDPAHRRQVALKVPQPEPR